MTVDDGGFTGKSGRQVFIAATLVRFFSPRCERDFCHKTSAGGEGSWLGNGRESNDPSSFPSLAGIFRINFRRRRARAVAEPGRDL